MVGIISEGFATFDAGLQVGGAFKLDEPCNGYPYRMVVVRMRTDGEQLPGLDVPEKYRIRLRAQMENFIARKSR